MLPDRISQAIPQGHGFIRSYVEYAASCSDAPEIFHVGVALTILASVTAKRLVAPFSSATMLVPNLYTLLVGPSGERKSSCLDTGIRILRRVASDAVIPVPGSYEEMIAQIRTQPTGLLKLREFGHFLKFTERGYGEPMRTVLMELYDHPTDEPYTRNLRKGKTVIDGPICVSLGAACSDDLLYSYTDTESWSGGFLGRMTMLYGDRQVFRMPTVWPQAFDYLVTLLHTYAFGTIHRCGGWSPPAWQEFQRWAAWRDAQRHSAPARVRTHVARAETLAAKVSQLYACDAGESNTGDGWLISHESMCRAIMFVEQLYLPSIFHLGEHLALGIWERDRQKVLNAIDAKPNGIERPDLLRRVKVSSDLLEAILTTLKDERTIVQSIAGRETVYRRAPQGGAPPPTGNNVFPIRQGMSV